MLPFFHSNMASVLPISSKIPSIGQEVTVTVGEEPDALMTLNAPLGWGD